MRFAFAFVLGLALLAACDLQPPPKKAAPAMPKPVEPVPAPITPPDAGVVAAGSGSAIVAAGSGSAAPVVMRTESTKACVDVSVRIAQVLIDNTTDVAQKAALEQDRSKIVRRAAETCTRDAWPQTVLDCLDKTTDSNGMRECTKDLKGP